MATSLKDMSQIKSIDMLFLDKVFEMESGYVLNFSDRTFANFFAEELNIDIDDLSRPFATIHKGIDQLTRS